MDQKLHDSPLALGMHPNSDIVMRQQVCTDLLQTLRVITPSSTASSGDRDGDGGGSVVSSGMNSSNISTMMQTTTGGDNGGGGDNSGSNGNSRGNESVNSIADLVLQDLLEKFTGKFFDLSLIEKQCKSNGAEVGPYQNVLLQECASYNYLVRVVIKVPMKESMRVFVHVCMPITSYHLLLLFLFFCSLSLCISFCVCSASLFFSLSMFFIFHSLVITIYQQSTVKLINHTRENSRWRS